MNKLEQLHFDGHDYRDAAEITEKIAVEFADFYASFCNKHGQTHSEEVFQEFLKTKQ